MPDEKRTDIALLPPQNGRLKPIAVQTDAIGNPLFADYGEMRRWCVQRVAGGGLPKHIQTAENLEGCVHLLAGLGLNVMASIGNTMIVNGVLGIWGDLPEALCRRTGELEDIDLYWTDREDARLDPEKPFSFSKAAAAVCKVCRKGQTPVVRFFTVDQAKTAGLLGKPGPWQQYTVTMLGHRARALALRAAFPDALRGVRIREADEFVEVTDGSGQAMEAAPGQTLVRRRAKQEQDGQLFERLQEKE